MHGCGSGLRLLHARGEGPGRDGVRRMGGGLMDAANELRPDRQNPLKRVGEADRDIRAGQGACQDFLIYRRENT